MKTNLKNITVIYNLPESSTVDDLDTQNSANGVKDGLITAGYKASVYGIAQDTIDSLKTLQTDLVFNLVEWSGRNSHFGVQAIKTLEDAHIPYTGSNSWGYGVSCDKVVMKELFVKNNIPSPKYLVVEQVDSPVDLDGFTFPLIVIPSQEHSAIGISQTSVCTTAEQAINKAYELINTFKLPALIEEFIDGDEAHVTVLEKNGLPWVLPPAVFRYQKKEGYWPINTYEAKWEDSWEAKMSAWIDEDISVGILEQMTKIGTQCYLHLGGRSYPRIDVRIHEDKVFVLEVNNNPGIDFDSESGIAYSAKKVGLDWPGLLRNIVVEAYIMAHRS